MDFKLEKITSEDWDRIWDDIKIDPEKFSLANKPNIRNFPIETWAIDRKKNSYLFWGPNYKSGADSAKVFSFFYQGTLYWLDVYISYPGCPVPGAVVEFNKSFKISIKIFENKDLLGTIKKHIAQAFAVHRFTGSLTDNSKFNIIFMDDLKKNG